MPDPHVSSKVFHVALIEYIPDETISFPLEELFIFTCHNPGSILAAVLQYRKAIVNRGCNALNTWCNEADNATHFESSWTSQVEAIYEHRLGWACNV